MAQEIVGSKMPAKNSYGQNGFDGASSDAPGEARTVSPMGASMPAVDLQGAIAKAGLIERAPRPAGMSTAAKNARKQSNLSAPQTREVDATIGPVAHAQVRQQNPDAVFGKKAALPASTSDSAKEPVRQP